MQEALKYFANIEEPRAVRNQKHPLMTLIGTTLLASLAGIDSFSGFADFTEAHYEKLGEYFDFPYGFASHDTISVCGMRLNPLNCKVVIKPSCSCPLGYRKSIALAS